MFVETASTITSVGSSNKWRAVTLFLAITAASQWIRGKHRESFGPVIPKSKAMKYFCE